MKMHSSIDLNGTKGVSTHKSMYLKYVLLFFLLLALFLLHHNSYDQFPSSKHAWAQADWYSMSLGFLENDFDFFHPQTYQLNLQFPAEGELDAPQGITAANFPIHPFLIAVAMKCFGSTDPVIYRSYSLLLALLGVYLLYKSTRLLSKSRVLAAGMAGFVLFNPVFSYYMNGFLPTFHALSTFFIALWFMIKYHKSKHRLYFVIGVLFLTLSALVRLPFSIHLIALFCTLIYTGFRRKNYASFELLVVTLGLMLVLAYFLYNQYLANTYGSVFLNHAMFPRSIQDFFSILYAVLRAQAPNFLPLPQLFVLGILIFNLFKGYPMSSLFKEHRFVLSFMVIDSIGIGMYAFIAWRQLYAHDYYYFDIFFVPILLIMLFVLSKKTVVVSTAVKVFVSFFLVSTLYTAYYSQRLLYADPIAKATGVEEDFLTGRDFLNSEHLTPDDKILIVPFSDVGLPLDIMQRKAFVVRSNGTKEINKALQLPFDYILVQNRKLALLDELVPDFNSKFKRVACNNKLTLYSSK